MDWRNIVFTDSAREGLLKAREHVANWCAERPAAVGVAEMALGAALIAVGIKYGAIEMGRDLVTSVLSPEQNLAFIGASTGGITGAASALLGNLGVVGGGLQLAVPALALGGAGALLLGLGGYGAGKAAEEFFNPIPALKDAIGPAVLLTVGIALMVDGGRRVLRDERVQAGFARFDNWTLELTGVSVGTIFTNTGAMAKYLHGEATDFLIHHIKDIRQLGVSSALVGLGIWGGSTVAVSSVTVLGSSTLGGLAMAVGLASPPVWPVLAGGAIGAAGSYAWSRHRRTKTIRSLMIGPPL